MECNVLVPGSWEISDTVVDDKGYTKHKFKISEGAVSIGESILDCMLKAEADILDPLIGESFPCAADMSIAPYWNH